MTEESTDLTPAASQVPSSTSIHTPTLSSGRPSRPLSQGERDLLTDLIGAVDRGEPEVVKRGQLRAWLRSLPPGSPDKQRVEMLIARLPALPEPPKPEPVDPEAGTRGRRRAAARNDAVHKEIEKAEQIRRANDPWYGR